MDGSSSTSTTTLARFSGGRSTAGNEAGRALALGTFFGSRTAGASLAAATEALDCALAPVFGLGFGSPALLFGLSTTLDLGRAPTFTGDGGACSQRLALQVEALCVPPQMRPDFINTAQRWRPSGHSSPPWQRSFWKAAHKALPSRSVADNRLPLICLGIMFSCTSGSGMAAGMLKRGWTEDA